MPASWQGRVPKGRGRGLPGSPQFFPWSPEPHRFVAWSPNSWFSHDVTKTQTKKLSILPRFHLHDALEQLKTNFHTNFRFKTVLGFYDVTKIQTKKLSILPRFHLHDALEQLKTNFHTNFRFKTVLGFVIEYAWTSKLLREAAFTWRPRELSCRLKKMTYFRKILLSKQFMY